MDKLLDAALSGDRQALARLLSAVEKSELSLLEIEQRIAPEIGNAFVVGITGPPGAGKSTLISSLLPFAKEACGRVGVLAVDPSSPFSRGALLGDRVRMQGCNHGFDVFIRSMASRGYAGGLAKAAATCVRLFDACGWPLVFIETLGVGQAELDVMDVADAVVVVLNPGWGDSFQANKAGLIEVGNLFVINKSDSPGLAQTRQDLLESLSLRSTEPIPAVVETCATRGDGIKDLWQELDDLRSRLNVAGDLAATRQQRRHRQLVKILRGQLEQRFDEVLQSESIEALLNEPNHGCVDLESGLNRILRAMLDR